MNRVFVLENETRKIIIGDQLIFTLPSGEEDFWVVEALESNKKNELEMLGLAKIAYLNKDNDILTGVKGFFA